MLFHRRPSLGVSFSLVYVLYVYKIIAGSRSGNFKLITSVQDYPFHALKAFEQKLISQEEFATIMMHWASKDSSKECIKLFYVDIFGVKRIRSKARDLIRQTLQTEKGRLLSEKELHQFFEIMKGKSPLEQQLFLESPKANTVQQIDAPLGPIDIAPPSIRHQIRTSYLGLNVFSYCTQRNKEKVMIPSFSMMQTLLDVRCKENSVRINPVLGLSKVSDIRKNGLNQSRDMALRFPEIFTPDEADSYKAEGSDFSYHDFFHAIVVSSSSKEDQIRFISIADAIKKTPTKEKEKASLKNWHDFFVDMELGVYYVSSFNKNNRPLFLDQLYDKINTLKYAEDESFHLSEETLDELAKNIGKAAFSAPLHRKDLGIFVQKLKADLWKEQMKIYSIEADLRKLQRKQPKDPSFELEGQIKLKAEELYSATDLLRKNQEMAGFFQTMLIESNL